jgi:hypothetical protein
MGNAEFSPMYGSWENDTLNYVNAADSWKLFVKEPTLSKGGYYSLKIGKICLILLNTVIYHRFRPEDPRADPYGQFAWLEQTCQDSLDSGFEPMVFFHIPPSISTRNKFHRQGWYNKYSDRFYEIWNRYRFVMVCGHLHMDTILPLFNSKGEKGAYILSVPGLSPRHDNNPGFRVFHLRNGKAVDYEQYYGDLIENPKDDVEWKIEYRFSEIYGAADLSQKAIQKVTAKIASDDELMWKYHSLLHAGNYEFRAFHQCMLQAMGQSEIEQCLAAKAERV